MSKEELIHDFDQAMMSIYQRARSEAGYNATRFLNMLHEHRGLETARILIHSDKVSDGYTALWERRRLDLTVEAMILDNKKYHTLFTQDELEICRKRLREYGHSSSETVSRQSI